MALTTEMKELKDGEKTIILSGRLDSETSPELEDQLTPLIPGLKNIKLNLTALEYISSAGLRLLIMLRKKLAEQKGKLVLVGVQPPVQAVLDLAEILPKTEIFANEEEADHYLEVLQDKEKLKGEDWDLA